MNKTKKNFLFKFLFLYLIIFIAYSPSYGKKSSKYHPNPVLGLVDGKEVKFEDVRNKKTNDLSLQLFQQLSLRLMEYSIEKLATKHSEIKLL